MNNSLMSRVMRWMKGQMMKRVHGMITCREFEDFIMRYLDDELTAQQKKVFQWHMKLCRECRDYLEAYRRTVELGRAVFSAPDESVPDDVPEDLVKAILDARKS